MNEWASCWCFGTPVGDSALLLVLRHSCWCFGTPVGVTALLLRGQPHFDRWFGTPVGAMALLLRGQARLVRCYDTSIQYRTYGLLLCCVLLISYDWSV